MRPCSRYVSTDAGTVPLYQHREMACNVVTGSTRSSSSKYSYRRSPLLTAWLRWQHGRAVNSRRGSLLHSSSVTGAACIKVAAAGIPAAGAWHAVKRSSLVSSVVNHPLPGGSCIGAAAGGAGQPAAQRKRGRPPKRGELPQSMAIGLPSVVKAEPIDAGLPAQHKHRGRTPQQVHRQQAVNVETASAATSRKAQVSVLDNSAAIKRRSRPPQQPSAAAAAAAEAAAAGPAAAGSAGVLRARLQRRTRRSRMSSASMQAADEQNDTEDACFSPAGLPAAAAGADEAITVSQADAGAADASVSSSSADGSNTTDSSMQRRRHMRRLAKRSVVVAEASIAAGIQRVPASSSEPAVVVNGQGHTTASEGQQQQQRAELLPAQMQQKADVQPDQQQLQQQKPTAQNERLKPGHPLHHQQQQQTQMQTRAEALAAAAAAADVGGAVWEGSENSYTLGGSAAFEPNRDSLWDVNADWANIVQRLEQALNIPAAPYSEVGSVLGSADPLGVVSSGGASSGLDSAQDHTGSGLTGSAAWQQQQQQQQPQPGPAAPNGFKLSTTISGHRYNGQMPLGVNTFPSPDLHQEQQQQQQNVPVAGASDVGAIIQPQASSSSSFLLRPGRVPLESSPIEPTPPDPPALVHPELAEASQLMAQRTQKTQQLLKQIQQIESVAQAKLSDPEMQALLVVATLSDAPAVAKWLQADPQVLKEGLDQLSQLQAHLQRLRKQRQQLEAKLAASRQQASISNNRSSSSSSSSSSVAMPWGSSTGDVTGDVTGDAGLAGGAASKADAADGTAVVDDAHAATAASSADIAAASLDLLQSILPDLEATARQQQQDADN